MRCKRQPFSRMAHISTALRQKALHTGRLFAHIARKSILRCRGGPGKPTGGRGTHTGDPAGIGCCSIHSLEVPT